MKLLKKIMFAMVILPISALMAAPTAGSIDMGNVPELIVSEQVQPVSPFQKNVDLIKYYANKYGVNEQDMLRVAHCESGTMQYKNGKLVRGDSGHAIGIYQYWYRTWLSFSEIRGITPPDILDVESQIEMTAWAFANGYKSHWTCK